MIDRVSTGTKNKDGDEDPGLRHLRLEAFMVRWTRAVAIFTLMLVIASAISDYFIYEQFVVANEAASDTREQLKAVVGHIGELFVSYSPNPNLSPDVYTVIERFHNYGNTRTSTFEAWSSVHYFETGIPNSQDFSKQYDTSPKYETIVSPNSDAPLPVHQITATEAVNASQGKGELIVWGRAIWANIFNPKDIKTLPFCEKLLPTLQSNGRFTFQSVPLTLPGCVAG